MCFVWIWEQTAIISLYSIKWLVFITEMEYVYCAVRTEFWQGSARFVMWASLRHWGPMVTVCTTSLTFTILRSAHTGYLCVLYGSQNKQRLFHYTALADCFLYNEGCVDLLWGMNKIGKYSLHEIWSLKVFLTFP